MKIRLSDKDYLLALGILVAVVIMLTTLFYADVTNPESKSHEVSPQRKTGLNVSPSVLLKKVFKKVDFKSFVSNNP